MTAVAYYPAWHGGFLWDDDGHITRPDLRAVHGLWRIWFEIGATQQYYPVVHSAFWVFHRLWGDDPFGYHLVNIILHATSAWLFVRVLQRLAVPGAWLAGLIFAVHPVEVESVAWITELKNTFSGACYLGAVLAYLHFDHDRSRRWYVVALAIFVVALLSKTVTATLPAALLVVFWWQRGRLRWREDVAPLVPFVALGLATGLVTAWVERTQIGATGAAFDLTFLERSLLAGRVIWFYLSKLVWPVNLIFIYPRWTIDAHAWVSYLYPLGVIVVVASLWALRSWSRAPLAVALIFVGTLVPALGFVNVYPFVFSFVADHFQYLAGLAVIAGVAASLTRVAARWLTPRVAAATAAIGLIAPFTVLTWAQSAQYADSETLYRTTITRNPTSWMAHNNLGRLLNEDARAHRNGRRVEDGVAEYRIALALKPDFAEAHNNLGSALLELDRFDEAAAEYETAQRLQPSIVQINENLGLVHRRKGSALQTAGEVEAAIAEYKAALALDSADAEAHGLLADALAAKQDFSEAIDHYRLFLSRRPHDANAWTGLGVALVMAGRGADAITAFRAAADAAPSDGHLRENLARALLDNGDPTAAGEPARAAVQAAPNDPAAHEILGRVLAQQGKVDEARRELERSLQLDPSYLPAREALRRLPPR